MKLCARRECSKNIVSREIEMQGRMTGNTIILSCAKVTHSPFDILRNIGVCYYHAFRHAVEPEVNKIWAGLALEFW